MSHDISPITHKEHQPALTIDFTDCHKADVITMIIVPILLAVAVSLSIYYAVHPVHPMIPIYGNFSLCLPMLICGGTGVVLAVVIIVQICRRKQVDTAFATCLGYQFESSTTLQEFLRTGLHPGGRPEGITIDDYVKHNRKLIEEVERKIGPPVNLSTHDQVNLTGYWHNTGNPDAPTVICFHGNMMTAEEDVPMGEFYKSNSFNVLLVEFRGYGRSQGVAASRNAEMEAYYDAEAALMFVRRQQGVKQEKVIAHGVSLGGAYAAALSYFFHLPLVVLHCTFTTYPDVASNASKVISTEGTQLAMGVSYNQGERAALTPDDRPLKTDGFSTLTKMQQTRSSLAVIHNTNDPIMPIRFGDDLAATKKGSLLIKLPGRHTAQPFIESRDAQRKLLKFFQKHGILHDNLLL